MATRNTSDTERFRRRRLPCRLFTLKRAKLISRWRADMKNSQARWGHTKARCSAFDSLQAKARRPSGRDWRRSKAPRLSSRQAANDARSEGRDIAPSSWSVERCVAYPTLLLEGVSSSSSTCAGAACSAFLVASLARYVSVTRNRSAMLSQADADLRHRSRTFARVVASASWRH
jgi:hypothetical protein